LAGTLRGIGAVCLAFFSFVRRLSERRASQLHARLQAQRQAAIGELRLAALIDLDIKTLLDRTVRLTAQMLEVPLVKVLELLPDGSGLRLRAGVGWMGEVVGKTVLGAGLDFQAGYTLQAGKPVVAGDLTHEPVIVGRLAHGDPLHRAGAAPGARGRQRHQCPHPLTGRTGRTASWGRTRPPIGSSRGTRMGPVVGCRGFLSDGLTAASLRPTPPTGATRHPWAEKRKIT
jgi:hypothetical protein